MCGIAGVAYRVPRRASIEVLAQMAGSLRHRGPDGYGFFLSDSIGLSHVRLSILDVRTGAQPMGNEDGRIVVVFNGEIYNHSELRDELTGQGHVFRTRSDTEVLVHGFEEWGLAAMLDRLNGQFAFALHDSRSGLLFLARDRFGIQPLFYAVESGSLVFASEVKALFASGEVTAALDPEGLDEVFTFWAARAPRTPFLGVRALEPGSFAIWSSDGLKPQRWFELDYPKERREPVEALATLDNLMRTAVRLRMHADVPVGGYLSGGLDSSITCSLAAAESSKELHTFSVTFDDSLFDESPFQQCFVEALGTRHVVREIKAGDIGRVFPAVVRHMETPILRTAPAPLFLLSEFARKSGIKAVLTGEGADEVFLGYDLFKETLVRRFCARQPCSNWRPRLFDRLHPYLGRDARGRQFWRQFFLEAGSVQEPLFSHLPRFLITSWIKQFYTSGMRAALGEFDALEELRASLPPAFSHWSALDRAVYLETTSFLSSYLLASQGDRMAMAHGVELRFPFLDNCVHHFANALPNTSKLAGLRDKLILRRWARSFLPVGLAERRKQPYRAPDVPSFFGPSEPEYVREVLDPKSLNRAGIFRPDAVTSLDRRCRSGHATSIRENQALVGILSTQLWYHEFFEIPSRTTALEPSGADVFWKGRVGSQLMHAPGDD